MLGDVGYQPDPEGGPFHTDDSNPKPLSELQTVSRNRQPYLMMARYYGSGIGRFVSPDPSRIGVDQWNPQTWNRYNYALNNPLNNIDRTGLYQENFHNGWTYMLARQAGFSEAEARAIGEANAAVDRGATSPFRLNPGILRDYHAFGADDAARDAFKTAALNATGLSGIGAALHTFQDSFSHRGIGTNLGLGHAFRGTKPDKLSSNPALAHQAALATYDVLSQKAKEMGKEGHGAPDVGLLFSLALADADIMEFDPGKGTLTVEVSSGKVGDLVGRLKKQGYTVVVDGVV